MPTIARLKGSLVETTTEKGNGSKFRCLGRPAVWAVNFHQLGTLEAQQSSCLKKGTLSYVFQEDFIFLDLRWWILEFVKGDNGAIFLRGCWKKNEVFASGGVIVIKPGENVFFISLGTEVVTPLKINMVPKKSFSWKEPHLPNLQSWVPIEFPGCSLGTELGGGFKYFSFSSLLGEDSHFD